MQVRAERLEPEVKRRRDPEVPTGAAEAPEELGFVGLRCAHQAPVRGGDLNGGQIVDREPEGPLEPANATAEGQSGDTGMTHDPYWTDEAVGLRRDVELPEKRPAVRPGCASPGIDLDTAHVRQVDHQAAIGAAKARGAVPARLDDDLEVVIARERDRGGDLLRAAWPGDDRWPPVMDRIPEAARIVVLGVARRNDVRARAPELIDVAGGERRSDLDDLASLERRQCGSPAVKGLSRGISGWRRPLRCRPNRPASTTPERNRHAPCARRRPAPH
jgi:hypothetical protein